MIAAVAIYLGVRAELRGEVDDSLRDRAGARTAARRRSGGGGRRRAGRPGAARAGRGAFPVLPPEPFGGPEGFAQLVLPSGRVIRPPGVERRAPGGRATRARSRAAARAST